MLLDNYTKQSPIIGVAGLGGGINSYIFLSADGGYEISRSLKFNSGDSAYLNRTPSSVGNRKTWTWSGWLKRSALEQYNYFFSARSAADNYFVVSFTDSSLKWYNRPSSGTHRYATSSAVFRDPSAWYHVVIAWDTTQSTDSDRVKLYVNGARITSFSASVWPDQNEDGVINGNYHHEIGAFDSGSQYHYNGYLSDVHFIDGQALAPTDFGEFDDDNVWQPKEFTSEVADTFDVFGLVTNGAQSVKNISELTSLATNVSHFSTGSTAHNSLTADFGSVGSHKITAGGYIGSTSFPNVYISDNGTSWTGITVGQSPFSFTGRYIQFARTSGSGYGGVYLSAVNLNSFHLPFTDNSSNAALGTDTSGNNNTWTVNNLTAASTKVATFNGTTNVSGSMTALGNQDWTVELFFEKTGSGTQEALFGFPGNWPYFEYDSGKLRWMTSSTYGPTLAQNQRYHAAWVRYNNKGYIYLDGTLISPSSGITYTDNDTDTAFAIGARQGGGTGLNGYMDNLRVVVGTALYTSNFTIPSTPLTAVANCKLLALQTDLTTDSSGQNVSLTNNGATFSDPKASSVDSLVDSPTNGTQTDTGVGGEITGNYATLNPLNTGANLTLSDGNLRAAQNSGGNYGSSMSTIGVSSDKWYCEMTLVNDKFAFGVGTSDTNMSSWLGQTTTDWVWRKDGNGNAGRHNGNNITYAHSTSVGDVIGLMLDLSGSGSQGILKYSVNGSDKGAMVSNIPIGPNYFITCGDDTSTGDANFYLNFGQRAFAYPVSGYKCLNTVNLPEPTIADGSKYFDTKLYTGNGGTQSVSGYNFSPDLTWVKGRGGSYGVSNHKLYDSVRGVTKTLFANLTNAETTQTDTLTSFNSDGFSLGSDTNVNASSTSFVGWAWDAGSSNTTIAVGSSNSSVYDQSQTWSGATLSGGGSLSNLFDGSLSTSATQSTNGTAASVSSFGSVSVADKVRFYSPDGGAIYTLNGGSAQSFASAGWHEISFSGSLTSFSWEGQSNSRIFIFGMEIDGKLLVDSGVTPPNVPSITSTVRANPTAGFSIVSFDPGSTTGDQSVGHGLNDAPSLILLKNREDAGNWLVFDSSVCTTVRKLLRLNTTDGLATESVNVWGGSLPSSTTFGVTVGVSVAQNKDHIAYCFSPIAGYSAMGSYVGNGSADGVFIYTGFTPSWILFKRSDSTSDWSIYDTTRDPHNVAGDKLEPNTSDAESAEGAVVDILSNGFKFRRNSLENGGNDVYIYMAFASHPFKSSRAR